MLHNGCFCCVKGVLPWFISWSSVRPCHGDRPRNADIRFSWEYGSRQCNSCLDSYIAAIGLALSRFFIKPKLKIEAEVVSNQLDVIKVGITRKWLKIRITNGGGAIATNCRADLDVTHVEGLRHPSDSKRLTWDDGSEENNIRRKDPKGEILKVTFRDSNFPLDYIHAMTCTKEAEEAPSFRAQDGFEFGDYNVKQARIQSQIPIKPRQMVYCCQGLYEWVDM